MLMRAISTATALAVALIALWEASERLAEKLDGRVQQREGVQK